MSGPGGPPTAAGRSPVPEIVAGFAAALSTGVAGSLLNDGSVSHVFVAILFYTGIATCGLIAAWLILVHRPHPPTHLRAWPRIIVALASALIVATIVAFALGLRQDPNFTSFYDRQDPRLSQCYDPASSLLNGDESSAVLKDKAGQRFGEMRLMGSPKCGTVWAEIYIDAAALERMKGQVLNVQMLRPADGAEAGYAFTLSGKRTEGWSNMLEGNQSCVRATASIVDPDSTGPPATTGCYNQR